MWATGADLAKSGGRRQPRAPPPWVQPMMEPGERDAGKRADKAERLARALRENLRRRKAQARGRADGGDSTEGGSASPPRKPRAPAGG